MQVLESAIRSLSSTLPGAELYVRPIFNNRVGKRSGTEQAVCRALQCVHRDSFSVGQLKHCALFAGIQHTECTVVNEMISVVPRDTVNADLGSAVDSIPYLQNARSLLRNGR